MAFDSPARSSPTLDRYLRHGSGSKSSHSQTIYARVPTKPKKFQSAHYDETTGTWRCKNCDYTYPNPEPHHHQRRAHKKICQGRFGEVHRWLSLSTGEEAEDSQETSGVVDKPATPETPDSATIQIAGAQQDKNAGLQALHLSDREFKFHAISSKNELPSEIETQEVGDWKAILSHQHGLVAAGENSEARSEQDLDSDPVAERDFKPRVGDIGRLLTLNSDFSIPRELSLDGSYPVDLWGVASSESVPVTDVSTIGDNEGMDIDRKEQPLSRISQDEAQSLKVGEDVLTADDAQEQTTEGTRGIQLSSDDDGFNDPAEEEFAEGGEPSLIAADDITQGVLQQLDESEMTTTEDRNAEELRGPLGEGFGETEAILPAAADDGALSEKEEGNGSEQGVVSIGVDETAYSSGDASSQLVRSVADEEASKHATPKDQSGQVVHASEDSGGFDGHHEAEEEVDAISLEPLSDDAEGVTEIPPKRSRTGKSVILSSAERNWDDWEHVVRGVDTSGKGKMPPLAQEIDDEGPPLSEDGLASSLSDNLEDDSADKNAPTLESRGTAVSTSDQEVGHEIGFQPAGLDWTLAFPDTVKKDVVKDQPVDSLESSTSVDDHSRPGQGRQELIPELDQETDPTNKMPSGLSAAEVNWDDWEDVIKRGPMLLEGSRLKKEQDPESSKEDQTPRVDCLGDLKDLGQGKTESERMSRPERSSPILESDLGDGERKNGLESPNRADSNLIVDGISSKQAGSVEPLESPPVATNSERVAMNSGRKVDRPSNGLTSVPQDADPLSRFPKAELEPKASSTSLQKDLNVRLDSGQGRRPAEGTEEVDDNESGEGGGDNLWEDDWEVIQKSEYASAAGSRHSSPSLEDAHDGELSSEDEYPTGRVPAAVNLPLGPRRWAGWQDLTNSEYMVLDGPGGESLVFKRASGDRDDLSSKARGGGRETLEDSDEDDDDGGFPSLRRRRRRQAPSSLKAHDRSPSFRSLRAVSPRGVVKSDYSAGADSFQGFETNPASLRSSSPRKSGSGGQVAPLVTRRPLIHPGKEAEDQGVTSEAPLGRHLHHHEHEDASRYDVEKVVRGQRTFELICPICGALITRRIIITKKKRRFVTSEGDSRWRRGIPAITPVEDDLGNRSPRSDASSEMEDLSGAWKQGIRPCLGYFFGS